MEPLRPKKAKARARVVGKVENPQGRVKTARFPKVSASHGSRQASVRRALIASTSTRRLGAVSPNRGRANSPKDLSKVPCMFHEIASAQTDSSKTAAPFCVRELCAQALRGNLV